MSRLILALGLASVLVVSPTPASAQTRDPAHEVGEPMWITGLSVFAATYLLTGATATTLVMLANARNESIAEAWIPLVGPFIMLGDSAGFDTTQLTLTAISAALQLLGCAALVTGIVLDAQPDPAGETAAALWLAPTFGGDGSGLSLAGRF